MAKRSRERQNGRLLARGDRLLDAGGKTPTRPFDCIRLQCRDGDCRYAPATSADGCRAACSSICRLCNRTGYCLRPWPSVRGDRRLRHSTRTPATPVTDLEANRRAHRPYRMLERSAGACRQRLHPLHRARCPRRSARGRSETGNQRQSNSPWLPNGGGKLVGSGCALCHPRARLRLRFRLTPQVAPCGATGPIAKGRRRAAPQYVFRNPGRLCRSCGSGSPQLAQGARSLCCPA
jgi:hypothetical protein